MVQHSKSQQHSKYKMLKSLPSAICASATYLALKTKGKEPWVRARHHPPQPPTPRQRLANARPPPRRRPSPADAAHARALVADARAREALDLQGGRPAGVRARHPRAAQERGDQQPAGRAQEVRAGEARQRQLDRARQPALVIAWWPPRPRVLTYVICFCGRAEPSRCTALGGSVASRGGDAALCFVPYCLTR